MLEGYYQPIGGRVGDVIPFFWDGTYHVFFLDYRAEYFNHTPPGARHTTWAHLTSVDLVHWQQCPVAIRPGLEGEVDSGSCATGSVFAHDGQFHILYTGRYFTTEGKRRETICHAISTDLMHWVKDPETPIARPDPRQYSLEHWRDPYVFWNVKTREFWMLVTAELADGPVGHRGCLALLTSTNLRDWEHRAPFWSPSLHIHHECPDVFCWRGWWYLLYSAEGKTIYRMARQPTGPWRSAQVDTFDDRFFYAAKTAGDENRRILFGWVASKAGSRDDGAREWGGHLVVRELHQDEDGTLWAKCPNEHVRKPDEQLRPNIRPQLGEWSLTADGIENQATDGFVYATIDDIEPDCQIRLTVELSQDTKSFGLVLRTDDQLGTGYMLRISPRQQEVVLGPISIGGRFTEEIKRHVPNLGSRITCTVTMIDSIIDVYVGDRVALAGRFHEHRGKTLALWAEEGSVAFQGIAIATAAS